MGSSQSSQKQVSRRRSNDSISSLASTGSENNYVSSRGNADARIISSNGAAVAMAKSSKGAAYVYTDGRNHKYDVTGNGQISVGNGIAYASAGKKNAAIAYSTRADKAGRLEGKKKMMITQG